MKYARLTKEQLEELHPEFITFLATQSIDKMEWDDIKKNRPHVAEQEIDLFSQKTSIFETLPEKKSNTPKIETEVKPIHSESKIERIVVFYTDGTFKNYTP